MGMLETRFRGTVLWGRTPFHLLFGAVWTIAEVFDYFFSLDLVPLVITFFYLSSLPVSLPVTLVLYLSSFDVYLSVDLIEPVFIC